MLLFSDRSILSTKKYSHNLKVVVVQSLSHAQLCDPTDCSVPGFPVLHRLPELTQIDVHLVGDAIQPICPLFSTSPLVFNLPQHQSFSSELALNIRRPKYWSFETWKVESYFIWWECLGLWAWETASVALRKLLQGGRRESQVIYKFATKGAGNLNIKDQVSG